MRILQLAPLWEAVPPPAYGGTEAVVSLLTEELVARGHDVTLAASGDSRTAAEHFVTCRRSLRRAEGLTDRNPYDWMHVATAIDYARDFDIVHNHAGELAMAMARLTPTPMLTTLHNHATTDTQFVWERYEGAYNTVSRAQQRAVVGRVNPCARYMGHVYNAVDVDSFPFSDGPREDLLFLSRMAPEKGPQHAIEVAKRTGHRLIMAGKVDAFDRDFFEEVIRGLIDGDQIVFLGEADARGKRELYRRAKCLLMPISWEEPFGLVMPEAMACGAPVVAFRRGSAPELIRHGLTGFVVDTVEEMAEAVADLGRIDPQACRRHVQAKFSPARMADEYLRMYARVLEQAMPEAGVLAGPASSRRVNRETRDGALAVA